jgi:hypothetical protein
MMNQNVTSWIVVFTFYSTVYCAAFMTKKNPNSTNCIPEGSLATTIQLAYSITILTLSAPVFPAMERLLRRY